MRLATERLSCRPDFVLIDGMSLPQLDCPAKAIVDGDSLCLSIAAASIVAKVARDRLMVEMDRLYPGYGFARHKGYGTPEHLQSLERYGVCPIHRKSFYPVRELIR
jgi:ribonuclease HII